MTNNKTFSKQLTSYNGLRRFKAIGHPVAEGFAQYYNFANGKFAGRVETVANFGISYRAYPASLAIGRLFNSLEEALDYLTETRELQTQAQGWLQGKRNQL